MRARRTVAAFATIWLLFLLSRFIEAQGPVVTNPVSRYVGAIQKQDFKTVIDFTYSYQQEIARIKAANPQVLWPKLLADYYASKESAFKQQAGYWQNYGEALGAMMGDPAQAIRGLRTLLPVSSKWTITESRTDHVQDSIAFGSYERTRVYVTVNYPSPADSPLVDRKLIKQTILEFTVNAKSQLVMAASELPQGRAFWTNGPPAVHIAMSKRFAEARLWDASIAELEPLERSGQLTVEGRHLLAQAYFQIADQSCLANYNGKERDCTPLIRHATSLDPSIGVIWSRKLLGIARDLLDKQFNAGVRTYSTFDKPESLVRTASEFIGGDQQLRASANALLAGVARAYVLKAMDIYQFDAFGRVTGEPDARAAVSKATQLYPSVLTDVQILAAAKEKLTKDVAGFEMSIISQYEVTNTIGFLVAFRVPIPPQDLPQFRIWTKYTTQPRAAGGPARWERAIDELGSIQSAPTVPETPVSTSTGALPASTGSPNSAAVATGADSISTLRSNIQFARTTAATMPLYNGDWRSVVTLTLSNSLSAYNQLYLAAINRRSIALDQLAAADLFLSKGDTLHAKAYWQKAVYLTLDSENLVHAANTAYSQGVSNTAAVLNAVYRLSSQSAEAMGYLACGSACYDTIDTFTLLTDYAVDNAIQGKPEADRNLIKNGITKLLLDATGAQKLATSQVTHFVGQPQSVHVIVDQVLAQPQLKTQIMTLLGRTSGYASNAAVSASAETIWNGLSAINRDCANIHLPVPVTATSATH